MLSELFSKLDKVEYQILMYAAKECSPIRFSDIQYLVELDSSGVTYKLKKLERLGLMKKLGKGSYVLRYKTPLCFIANEKHANMYIGMLGLRNERDVPEPEIALELLREQGINIDEAHIFATEKTVEEWKEKLGKYALYILSIEELKRIEKMEKKLEDLYTRYMHEKVIILDCTSLTKTATIAFYKIATKHYAPLIYIYEHTKELIWLQNRKIIKEKLKPKSLPHS